LQMDEEIVGGKLKLKRKKKKLKLDTADPYPTSKGVVNETNLAEPQKVEPKKTKAELAFERRQAQLQAERIAKRAKTSHREKVEKFNEYLDNLTELNDIPKVSWTK
ncbi:Protein FAM32A, partial [Trichinella zimbabwensis]